MGATAPAWTGWLEADLGVATLDVAMRLDLVEWRIGSRSVAVVDRARLRAWVQDPSVPLRVDDVTFLLVDAQLHLRIDGAGPFPLPAGLVSQLVREL